MKEGTVKFSILPLYGLFMHQPEGALCMKIGDGEYKTQGHNHEIRRKIKETTEVYLAKGCYFVSFSQKDDSP